MLLHLSAIILCSDHYLDQVSLWNGWNIPPNFQINETTNYCSFLINDQAVCVQTYATKQILKIIKHMSARQHHKSQNNIDMCPIHSNTAHNVLHGHWVSQNIISVSLNQIYILIVCLDIHIILISGIRFNNNIKCNDVYVGSYKFAPIP